MAKIVTHDVQTTVDAYLRDVPRAIGHMDYEVRGNRVVAHSQDGTAIIDLTYEGERQLGSLDLPMTKVEISLIGFSEDKATEFLSHYDKHMFRAGGG